MANNEQKQLTRRLLLKALKLARPGVLSAEELLAGLPIIHDEAHEAAASEELENLITWLYVERLGQANAPLYRITAAGLNQYTLEVPAGQLDPRLHGAAAYTH